MTEQSQQQTIRLVADNAGITPWALWLHYFSIGGNLGVIDIDAYLYGVSSLPPDERNMVALALNELIDELPERPVPR